MIYNCLGTYLHFLAALALLMKIWCTQDCSGISGESQFLYALVYSTRYMDLFTVYVSTENTILKILFIILGYLTVVSIYLFFRKSHEDKYDTFRSEILVISSLAVALLINHELSPLEVAWTFSVYLEAVALLPQYHFVSKAKYIHKHVLYYVLGLGAYKGLSLIHWVYRYYDEGHYDNIMVAGALVQFLLFCDFFARVVPNLKSKPARQPDIAIIGPGVAASMEEQGTLSKEAHLKCNISTIVLTPASLVGNSSDKEKLLAAEEKSVN